MTYTPTTWTDETLAGAERYEIADNDGTPIESNVQINLTTPVAVAGTAVTADKMNNIENGVSDLDTAVGALETTVSTMPKDLTGGTNVTIDDTDPEHPVISATGGTSAPATTALNDMQFGDGSGAWIKRTLADSKSALEVIADATADSYPYARYNNIWLKLPHRYFMWNPVKIYVDETIVSSTTLRASSLVLSIYVKAVNYTVRGEIFYKTPAAADFKWQLSIDRLSNVETIRAHVLPGTTAEVSGFDLGTPPVVTMLSAVATGYGYIRFTCHVECASGGTIRFTFAQNTSNAGTTAILAGSYMEAIGLT
jgi:hypothetical protein